MGRIGGLHNRRRDTELGGIKIHRIEEPATATIGHIRRLGVLVVVVIQGPVRSRHLVDGIDALTKGAPVAIEIRRLGKERPHTDDGDRLAIRACSRGLYFFCNRRLRSRRFDDRPGQQLGCSRSRKGLKITHMR